LGVISAFTFVDVPGTRRSLVPKGVDAQIVNYFAVCRREFFGLVDFLKRGFLEAEKEPFEMFRV
jgi:hypothetical protein